jgi:hypothetical protein
LNLLAQKESKVNLSPHNNFGDLMQNGVPDFSMVEKMRAS